MSANTVETTAVEYYLSLLTIHAAVILLYL